MKRWPFRKRNSLGRLIDRTKQVLDDGTGQDNMQKLAALQVLEKQRQVMRVSVASALFDGTYPGQANYSSKSSRQQTGQCRHTAVSPASAFIALLTCLWHDAQCSHTRASNAVAECFNDSYFYTPLTSMPGFQLIPGGATRRIRATASPSCCPTTPNLATLPPPAKSGLSPSTGSTCMTPASSQHLANHCCNLMPESCPHGDEAVTADKMFWLACMSRSYCADAHCGVQSCQSKDMDEKIKSYRQAIFKLDHAERKRGEAPPTTIQSKCMLLPDFDITVCSSKQKRMLLPGFDITVCSSKQRLWVKLLCLHRRDKGSAQNVAYHTLARFAA